MKNNTNIYDIDGNLIRTAGDNHKMSLEEAQERIKFYNEKVKELGENDPKIPIYTTYLRNLTNYVLSLYSTMSPEEMTAQMNAQKQLNTNEQIEKAINELKKEIEEEESTVEEPKVVTQEDLLVDGEGRPEAVMDEYVPFEEVTNESNIQQSDPS